MERKAIELGGIIRNLPDNTVKDGVFHELINLRPKDGALRPVGTKDYIWDSAPLYPANVRWIHRISDTIRVYWGSFTNPLMLSYWIITNEVSGGEVVTSIPLSSNMRFASLSNSLIISDITNEVPFLLIYNVTDGGYDVFDEEFLPSSLPSVIVRRNADSANDESGKIFTISAETDIGDAMLSQYVKMQRSKADKGYLTGNVLVRCAWELFDGTIVKHTIPQQVPTSEIDIQETFGADILDGTPGWSISTSFTGYGIQVMFPNIGPWLANFKTKYENIIKKFKVYVSMPKSPEIVSEGEKHRLIIENQKWWDPTPPRVFSVTYDLDELKDYSPDPETEIYYLLKEFGLDELSEATWINILDSEYKTVSDLATRSVLPVDNNSHHQLFANTLFAYNERIFFSDIKNILFKGWPLGSIIGATFTNTNGAAYDIGIEYEILVKGGEVVKAFSGWQTFNYRNSSSGNIAFALGKTYATPFFGYPDSRARSARIFIRESGVVTKIATAKLTSVPAHNFAYIKGRDVIDSGTSVPLPGALSGEFLQLLPIIPGITVTENANYYYDHDRIQATEINNPFYYPAINSYRVQGKVLGLSTNAIALSSGQFGQFPIYAFTNEGIWTMSIGTGETLINTITPLSREVCNNPKSITPIDGGTAFVSGRGLFIISGNQVIEISETAEGQITSRLTGLAAYNTLLSGPNLSGMSFVHCSVQFLEYLSGAALGFDYVNSELIVTNRASNPNYSWVYSLKSKIWFKISQAWNTFVTDYPTLYAYDTNRVARRHEMNVEDFRSVEDDLALVFGQTRPIKISGAYLKKIHRVNLGGNIQNDITPVVKFSVAVFGTTDNKTWMLLNNGRDFGTDDIMLLGRSQYSIRQIIVVFGGHVEADSYLNYLTFDFEERYGGKLR